MSIIRWVALLLLLPSIGFASPVITSVTPTTGPVTGGTTVIIRGTGFSDNCILCSPPFADPEVYFGDSRSPDVTFVDSTTLHAITPPSLPGSVAVSVAQKDGSNPNFHVAPNAFTYDAGFDDGAEPVLFPIFMQTAPGANGSLWVTEANGWNKSDSEEVVIYGIDSSCAPFDPPIPANSPQTIRPGSPGSFPLFPACSQSVGRLMYVSNAEWFAPSLRVFELSRQAENHGVEIPVVRRDDFTEGPIALVDVPLDLRFRLTLRIYGLSRESSTVMVSFAGRSHEVQLQPGASIYEPSYAQFTDFTPDPTFGPLPQTVNVVIEPRTTGAPTPGTPIWAFIAVTNNQTQHITTVTPQ